LTAAGTTRPDQVVLTCAGELSSSLSLLLQGDAATLPALFGDGVRCIGGRLERLYARNAQNGSVALPAAGDPSITARSAALGDPIAAGSSRFYQVLYRDGAAAFCAGSTWNASNALSIAW